MHTCSRLLRLALLVGAIFGAAAVHAQDALSTIVQSKKIRVAIPIDYPPYGFVGADMKPQGLDIDMANYVAGKLGVSTVELVPVNSANRVPYLLSKKVDVVISTLGKTPEREKVVDFTHAYSPFYQAVFAAKSTKITNWADLAGKTVSVTRGAMADTELEKVMPKGTIVKRFDDHVGTLSAFMSGQVQVVATSVTEGAGMIEKNPQVEYKLLLKDSPNFMGVNKGEEALKNKLDQIILDARKNGDLEKLSRKWLNRSTGDLPL
ncbi:transporter substrate-binding domain-containing protein [Herbaspirillum sp. RV1423]|uniref:transporter substrate-binding domain-containing protein n=1 Tax=Herbaspirillum sp. RV1423 TaxID=1443993 RepID=UPI0004B9D651|nr:transporter substrate-binding domain-containing protein [Herbaspirillum sp. RV1423]